MNLEEYARLHKLNLRQLAPQIGISYGTLWKCLHGCDMRLSTAHQIVTATAGAVTYDEIFLQRESYLKVRGTPVGQVLRTA